jgi:hypothetical protein
VPAIPLPAAGSLRAGATISPAEKGSGSVVLAYPFAVFRNCLHFIDELYYAHGRADLTSF